MTSTSDEALISWLQDMARSADGLDFREKQAKATQAAARIEALSKPPLELDLNIARGFPDGTLDQSTFDAIETALDKADAPCRDGGRWLTLPERIASLHAQLDARTEERDTLRAQFDEIESRAEDRRFD